MDDRRRTISSEDSMVGEALMRISNTMEADRLTKSLDYQEKLRSRSNIRLIIGIVCMIIAFMMLATGGMLLFVLIKFEDPILDTLVPLIRAMINGMNASFQSTVETVTYLPILQQMLIKSSEEGLKSLQNINAMDFNGIHASVGATLGGVSNKIAGVGGDLTATIAQAGDKITGVLSGFTDGSVSNAITASIADALAKNGVDVETINSIVSNIAAIMDDLTGGLASNVSSTASAGSTANAASTADLLASIGSNGSGADALGAGVSTINGVSNALSGIAGIF